MPGRACSARAITRHQQELRATTENTFSSAKCLDHGPGNEVGSQATSLALGQVITVRDRGQKRGA